MKTSLNMKEIKYIVVLSIMLLSQMIYAQFSPGLNSYSIGGRAYDVRTPSDYVASKAYPIVFELHGGGGNISQQQDQGVVDEQQYIAVYPEGTGIGGNKFWNTWSETDIVTGGADDVAHLTAVYNEVKTNRGAAFDTSTVYAYGWSNGGAMAMKMVEETSLFKAVVIRAMTLVNGQSIPASASKVPMIFIHGTADTTVPYNGGKPNSLSPDFMDVKTAVQAWATHNGCVTTPQDIHYLASGNIGEFWFREYANTQVNAPVYLYAIPGAPHATNGGFSRRNNKRTAIRLFKGPRCYGLARNSASCQN